MTRKQLVGRILLVLIGLVVLAGAGCGLYRLGYVNGVDDASDEHVGFGRFSDGDFEFSEHMLENWPWAQLNRRGGMMFDFDDHMQTMPQTFNRFTVTRNNHSRYAFNTPFSILFRLICLGFFVWAGYTVITAIFGGKGWRLSFQKMPEDDRAEEAKTGTKKKS